MKQKHRNILYKALEEKRIDLSLELRSIAYQRDCLKRDKKHFDKRLKVDERKLAEMRAEVRAQIRAMNKCLKLFGFRRNFNEVKRKRVCKQYFAHKELVRLIRFIMREHGLEINI